MMIATSAAGAAPEEHRAGPLVHPPRAREMERGDEGPVPRRRRLLRLRHINLFGATGAAAGARDCGLQIRRKAAHQIVVVP